MSRTEKNEENKTSSHGNGIIILLLLISLLTNLTMGYYISTGGKSGTDTTAGKQSTDAVATAVMDKYLANEYEKAGSKENYDLLAKAQRLQMVDQLPQIKQFIASKEGGVKTGADTTTTPVANPSAKNEEKKNTLEVFIMAYCPFGEIAAKQLPAILKQLKADKTTLDIHYIASKTGEGFLSTDFESLHKNIEAEEDIRQMCIKKSHGVNGLVDYMQVRYANADNYGRVTDTPDAAYKAIGANKTKIEACVTSGEGGKLLAEDIKIAQANGISASPTWLINNTVQAGGIEAAAIVNQFCAVNKDLAGCKVAMKSETPQQGGSSGVQCAQ